MHVLTQYDGEKSVTSHSLAYGSSTVALRVLVCNTTWQRVGTCDMKQITHFSPTNISRIHINNPLKRQAVKRKEKERTALSSKDE